MQIGQIDLFAIISIAFFGSMSHCIGMCGGFVLAYTTKKLQNKNSFYPHVLYNFGRVTSYVILGVIAGAVGSVFRFSTIATGYIFFIIGIFMVLTGLSLLGKITFLNFLESNVGIKVTKRFLNYYIQKDGIWSFFALGMANGFIPCGLVYFFLATATSTQSWLYGGAVMAIFGVVTLISMLGFTYVVSLLKELFFRDMIIKITAIMVIIYGIYMGYVGFISIKGIS